MGIDERNKIVQNLHLCFNCLKGKHMSKDCRKPQVCTVSDCTVKHHSLLHRWVTDKDHIATQPAVSCAATNTAFQKLVWVLFLLLSKAVTVIPAVHMHC